MTKEIKLSRLETRFLLNFTADENNILWGKDTSGFNILNLNNLDQDIEKYKKKIRILKNKLMKLDESFYNLK